ncbi:hypothetical protein MTO96_035704 [Rhipicephalus appendiculatus]
MHPGESLLVHSGSGGVGQAAISIALAMGCTVFTTVGSHEKRDFLKRRFPQLEDRHIANSRDLSFEEHVLRETDGRGVDLVLNSLADAKLKASVRCLAENGRFLEIGKFDLSKDSPLGMSVFLKSVTFHGITLESLYGDSPFVVAKRRHVMQLLREGMASGVVRPLNAERFTSDQVEEAFRYMASGKHVGKVVLEMRPEETQPTAAPPKPLSVQAVARTRFYEEKSNTASVDGKKLEQTSFVATIDAATLSGSLQIIKEAAAIGPVGGIFNLGVVLHDALLENQTAATFEAVCKIKIDGTRHLDELSRKLCPKLDHFVVFSSIASSRGNLGQSNYGFANAAMERICEKRTAAGLPGLAIQWGPVDDVGLFQLSQSVDIEGLGLVPQRIASCISVMDQLLSQKRTVVSSYVKPDHTTKVSSEKGDVTHSIARILGIKDPSSLKPDITFGDYGMDSLMAVEVKQTLERDFDLALSMQQIRQLTIKELRNIGHTSSIASTKKKSLIDEQGYLPVRAIGVQRTTDVPLGSITEMAATYLKVILQAQPRGPYHIVGYSYGCAVAFEMAVHLQATGATVGSLIFLDGAPQYVRLLAGYRRDLLDEGTNEQETNIMCSYLMRYIASDFSEVRDKLSQCNTLDAKLDAAIDIFLMGFSGRSTKPRRHFQGYEYVICIFESGKHLRANCEVQR